MYIFDMNQQACISAVFVCLFYICYDIQHKGINFIYMYESYHENISLEQVIPVVKHMGIFGCYLNGKMTSVCISFNVSPLHHIVSIIIRTILLSVMIR